ncbi:MipA/OmpV family protein [Consotaella aegiceratis]|uniref:MipA/OmpV family protein n=1 Tax=Consotaella aegiceratis TaxID=3097961 RepID=UPI002F402028
MSFSFRNAARLPVVGVSALAGVATPFFDAALAADAVEGDAIPLPVYEAPDPARFGGLRQQLGEWDVMLGAGAMVEPKYEGSDEFEITPVPFISATFGDRLTIDPGGVTADLYETGPLKFSATLGYEGGRNEDDADELDGLGDIDFGVTVGGRASATFGPAEFYASVEKTIEGSEGLLGVAGIELTHAFTPSLLLGLGASATYADDNHMEAYFGIDADQARRSGYETFDAEAGFKRVDFTASATVAFTENWFARGEADVGILVGDAADSPIVKEEVQPSGMLLIGYRF